MSKEELELLRQLVKIMRQLTAKQAPKLSGQDEDEASEEAETKPQKGRV